MIKVYELWPDANFQYFDFDDDDVISDPMFSFSGKSIEGEWEPPSVYSREPRRKKPDIWQMFHAYAFEPNAAKILDKCLAAAGERLPLPFEDRVLTVLNVTHIVDSLDKKKSVYDRDLPHVIDKYVFHKKRLNKTLFMIPQTKAAATLYTVEGLRSPEEEFKPLVEKHKLKGLRFIELWSDE